MKSIISIVLLLTLSTTTTAQTSWTKNGANPVLNLGSAGAWDDVHVLVDKVIKEGSVYKMWYSGFDGASWRMGHATSPDGITWTKHASNPVLNTGPSTWDSQVSYRGKVIVVGSQYRMWYTGSNSNQTNERVGYATSSDGIIWTKVLNPVLTAGPSTWDAGQVGRLGVMGPDTAGGYKMWFSGFAGDYSSSQIGYATAANESSWTKLAGNPVLTPGASGSWDDLRVQGPTVLYVGGIYRMWYVGTRAEVTAARIGYATSSDGIIWTKHGGNPVLAPGSGWDGSAVAANDVLYDGSTYKMWYSGFDGTTWRIGYASVITSVSKESGNPVGYSLDQNYPNPFNPSTEIRFDLPWKSYVRLTVFDLLGREVTTLVSEELSSGSYGTRWDATGLPSGVYLYVLKAHPTDGGQAGEFVETKKLVLLK